MVEYVWFDPPKEADERRHAILISSGSKYTAQLVDLRRAKLPLRPISKNEEQLCRLLQFFRSCYGRVEIVTSHDRAMVGQ